MPYWGEYKRLIAQNIFPDKDQRLKNFNYYRDFLFYYFLIYAIPFAPIAIIPGILVSINEGAIPLAVMNGLIYLVILFLAFSRSVSINYKKAIFLFSLYAISIALLYYVGVLGPGLMYLFGFTIVCSLIYSIEAGFLSIIVNLILVTLIGFNIHFQWFDINLGDNQTLSTWFGVSTNLIFLSLVIVACFRMLFLGVDNSLEKERNLSTLLQNEHKKTLESKNIIVQKNEELNQFAHIVSHDLKEPLRSMQAFSELLKNKYGQNLDEKGTEWLQHIKVSSLRMGKLLDSLLEYSQIGKEKELTQVDSNKIMQELLIDLSYLINENKAIIDFDDLPKITAHYHEFKQLLQNLIANAIKFRKDDEAALVRISAIETENEWQFSIKDNGIGISKNDQSKIFIIFHQLHKNRFTGSGIGLANCKKIVELHGGKIWVESALNEGSIFYFTIPKSKIDQLNNLDVSEMEHRIAAE